MPARYLVPSIQTPPLLPQPDPTFRLLATCRYQQLRILKLDEIDAVRAMNSIQASPVVGQKRPSPEPSEAQDASAAPAGAATVSSATAPAPSEAPAPGATDCAAPAAAALPEGSLEEAKERLVHLPNNSQLRVAIDPARQITPPEFCQSMWRQRMTPHAEPRVGMPRSVSVDGTNGNLSKDASGVARRGLPMTHSISHDGSTAGAPSASVPLNNPNMSPAQSVRTPFGYVKGAICVEPPKRQRTGGNSSSLKSPKPTARTLETIAQTAAASAQPA